MKDTAFYNAESGIYSKKRYPILAADFPQYFFKERLRLTVALLEKFLPGEDSSLLEIGCADGVVARAIWNAFPKRFSRLGGVDISPGMIAVAKEKNADTHIVFSVREGDALGATYHTIVEIGVLNYTGLEKELGAVADALESGGTYICSTTGSSSFYSKIKGREGFLHDYSYPKYEEEFRKRFTIVQAVPIGFFVPWLWKVPALARALQPVVERMALMVVPNLAHEKIYVLTPHTK